MLGKNPAYGINGQIPGGCQGACIVPHLARDVATGTGRRGLGGVITEAAVLGARRVVFTTESRPLRPGLSRLVRHALGSGLEAEVFSNLHRIHAVRAVRSGG